MSSCPATKAVVFLVFVPVLLMTNRLGFNPRSCSKSQVAPGEAGMQDGGTETHRAGRRCREEIRQPQQGMCQQPVQSPAGHTPGFVAAGQSLGMEALPAPKPHGLECWGNVGHLSPVQGVRQMKAGKGGLQTRRQEPVTTAASPVIKHHKVGQERCCAGVSPRKRENRFLCGSHSGGLNCYYKTTLAVAAHIQLHWCLQKINPGLWREGKKMCTAGAAAQGSHQLFAKKQ